MQNGNFSEILQMALNSPQIKQFLNDVDDEEKMEEYRIQLIDFFETNPQFSEMLNDKKPLRDILYDKAKWIVFVKQQKAFVEEQIAKIK